MLAIRLREQALKSAGAQQNSGYRAYGARKGFLVGSDANNYYVIKYPVY